MSVCVTCAPAFAAWNVAQKFVNKRGKWYHCEYILCVCLYAVWIYVWLCVFTASQLCCSQWGLLSLPRLFYFSKCGKNISIELESSQKLKPLKLMLDIVWKRVQQWAVRSRMKSIRMLKDAVFPSLRNAHQQKWHYSIGMLSGKIHIENWSPFKDANYWRTFPFPFWIPNYTSNTFDLVHHTNTLN